jgi:hypothetical protein
MRTTSLAVAKPPVVEAERARRHLRQVALGDAVVLGRQLARAERLRAERVESDGEVPVLADPVHERRGRGRLAQQVRIAGGVRRRPRPAGDSRQRLGRLEVLSPGLVHRRRVAAVRLERLGDVRVVEDARDGWGSHERKITGAAGADNCGPDTAARKRRAGYGGPAVIGPPYPYPAAPA